MKLIVGLGNPGMEYSQTRHNVGFLFVDYFCSKHCIKLDNFKFNGFFTKTVINNEEVIVAKPQTYMNLSGEFVQKICHFYNISTNNVLIIHDDLDTEVGKFKIKQKGSSGGQNGLKNIINNLKTEQIKRIKIGIGKPINNINISNYVLSKIPKEEFNMIVQNFEDINNAVESFITNKLLLAMNKYN